MLPIASKYAYHSYPKGNNYAHETELAYNQFRYYSPKLGRYISEDQIRFNSRVYSFYVYVPNPNLVIGCTRIRSELYYYWAILKGKLTMIESYKQAPLFLSARG